MDSIRVRNLRSFADDEQQPYIDLKPITIFVGKNSCGKSSLLRTLPLLRQSIESKTRGPILWYGDYVDYGAFSQAINAQAVDKIIYFDFKLKNNFSLQQRHRVHQTTKTLTDVVMQYGFVEKNKGTIPHSLLISFDNINISIDFEVSKKVHITIDGQKVLSDGGLEYSSDHNFLPNIINSNPEISSRRLVLPTSQNDFFNSVFEAINLDSSVEENIVAINDFGFSDASSFKELLLQTFKDKETEISQLSNSDEYNLYIKLLTLNIPILIESINRKLMMEFRAVKYIAPLRATAERYYRFQDFSVEEIDHTGSNLAMLLRSLDNDKIVAFQDWTNSNFGFKVRALENGLHYEIMIQIAGEEENNISDMGFGFSQILPIVTSIWFETINRRRRFFQIRYGISTTFVIEQPELHLHPEYQARLATIFAKVASLSARNGLRILFETHSKTMINAIGDSIENGDLNKDYVNIVLFNKNAGVTTIELTNFDEDGDLINWPVGFFSGR